MLKPPLIACLVTGALLLPAGLWALFRQNDNEKPFRRADFDHVVQLIDQGKLRANPEGVVELPSHLTSLTSNGCVYVFPDRFGFRGILFPSWIGRMSLIPMDNNLAGYILDRSKERTTQWCPRGPAPVPPGAAQTDRGLAFWDLESDDRPIVGHWFHAFADGPSWKAWDITDGT